LRPLPVDHHCQTNQAAVLAQLKLLEVETQTGLGGLEKLWCGLDAQVHAHPEAFQESLQKLLPDLSDLSEIEVDLLSKLVLACGDLSLVPFVKLGNRAIAAGRDALKSGCAIVTDIPTVTAALDQTRLAHLGCSVKTLIDNPHITCRRSRAGILAASGMARPIATNFSRECATNRLCAVGAAGSL
jgi:precorrin-8X/cobalt-precorrin-8 methylmutase